MSPLKPLSLKPECFDPANVSPASRAFNAKLREIGSKGPQWYEVGAAKARQYRAEGRTALPGPTILPSASSFEIPSRDPGRTIPCRILKPQSSSSSGKPPRAVFMHIHGGGWVLQDETYQDPRLQAMADAHGLVCISIGYRLAPENPFPAGPRDCYDAVEWLVSNAEAELGAPLGFIGGESAGAHLSMLTILHLLQHETAAYRDFRLKGALLQYGCFSLKWMPGVYTFPPGLVLDINVANRFRDAFIPGWTQEMLEDPLVSPLYADFRSLWGKLPPALFTCGTEDCLLDDTLLMSAKWLAAGGETQLVIVPGAPHGYIAFPRTLVGSGAEEGSRAVDTFVEEKLGA